MHDGDLDPDPDPSTPGCHRCLDPILSIVSLLSCKSPFVRPVDKKDEASLVKVQMAGDSASDHKVRCPKGWGLLSYGVGVETFGEGGWVRALWSPGGDLEGGGECL